VSLLNFEGLIAELEKPKKSKDCLQKEAVDTADDGIKAKKNKEFEVPVAHTVVDPITVMVHQKDAFLADFAVVRPCRLPLLAFLAFSVVGLRNAYFWLWGWENIAGI
jgi:hypothetical protein